MPQNADIARMLQERAFISAEWAKAWALLQIANSQRAIAEELSKIGTNGSNTDLGAIEMVAMEIKNFSSVVERISRG